ncbi:hypothetical protein L6R52_32505, partial [Myxococcota bacterium]|nr:hypothetical protein [Myxococcota bacterium]
GLFGPRLPRDIVFEPVAAADPALAGMTFHASYDEGYCGQFSVPGGAGAAARAGDLLASGRPLALIRDHLAFGRRETGETVVFMPGLNTLHRTKPGWEGETTTVDRLGHYVGVLGDRRMAQLHLGTDMDQGNAPVPVPPGVRALLEQNAGALRAAGLMPAIEGDTVVFDARQRDRVEAALAQVGVPVSTFQETAIAVLRANEGTRAKLVFMPYSRASIDLGAALVRYADDYVARHPELGPAEARRRVEAHLRETLTVVTIGNAFRSFPNGPAYLHLSAHTDPLTLAQGVRRDAPAGAGRDAVFLHYDGLFEGFDAHNFGAAGAQALELFMEKNQATTYRALWEKAQRGELRAPTRDEVAAKSVLTGGPRWLWSPDVAARAHLPTEAEARGIFGAFEH